MTTVNAKYQLALFSIYAIAMALLEAVVVVYMRQLYYPENPQEVFPLSFLDSYNPAVELSREIATIVMIIAVALIGESRSLSRQFAAFLYVFGLWDIFYYVWLKVLMDWPRTWLEWDVLFLVPVIWLGPWICPAAVASLFTVWGAWALTTKRNVHFRRASLVVFTTGSTLGLATFFEPAITYANQHGHEALNRFAPNGFWWPLFAISLMMMAAGLLMASQTDKPVT